MTGKKKDAGNNQWVSTITNCDENVVGAKNKPKKTAGNNQWVSTNKNPQCE